MATFGNRFRELRKTAGLTQEELVADFDRKHHFRFSKSAISQYENGKRIPEIEALAAFADYFGVTVDYLLGRSDVPSYPRVPLTAFLDYLPDDLREFVAAHGDASWIELARDMKEYNLTPRDISDLLRMVTRLQQATESKDRG